MSRTGVWTVSMAESDLLFAVDTPLGFAVRVTLPQWRRIIEVKHPVMAGREGEVRETLAEPIEIRQSRQAPDVYLWYKETVRGRWVCAVTKQNLGDGFLITVI